MLAITAMGMISAVGRDAATSCASLRAGITRTRGIQSFTVLDVDEHELIPLLACPVHGFAEGFQRLGTWVRLAAAALRDLLRSSSLPGGSDMSFWQHTALLAVTPILDAQRFDGMEWTTSSILKDYVQAVARLCGISLRTDLAEVIPAGHAGAAMAIERASEMVGQGVSRVLVLAADSYLDPVALEWLAGSGRLKTPGNPTGLIPGEAAACVLLEPLSAARLRNRRPIAVLHRFAVDSEQDNYVSGKRSQGGALASVIERVFEPQADSIYPGDLIADVNGEEWRAYELGTARVRLRDRLDSTRFLYPAVSFGETGAASGVAGLCVAALSLERGYARGGAAVVTNSSDNGCVGAMYLS
jgi:3-oxoacyl-[acyl-carrier-protein] synthase I